MRYNVFGSSVFVTVPGYEYLRGPDFHILTTILITSNRRKWRSREFTTKHPQWMHIADQSRTNPICIIVRATKISLRRHPNLQHNDCRYTCSLRIKCIPAILKISAVKPASIPTLCDPFRQRKGESISMYCHKAFAAFLGSKAERFSFSHNHLLSPAGAASLNNVITEQNRQLYTVLLVFIRHFLYVMSAWNIIFCTNM